MKKLAAFGVLCALLVWGLPFIQAPGRSQREPLRERIDPMVAYAQHRSDFIPFSSFRARAEIALGVAPDGDCFDLWALFVLGEGSDGIDPIAETVTLFVESGKWTMPRGSFFKDDQGRYRAEALIAETLLEMMIRPLGENEFELRASAARAELVRPENPLAVRLMIGDDGGKTTVLAEIWSPLRHQAVDCKRSR